MMEELRHTTAVLILSQIMYDTLHNKILPLFSKDFSAAALNEYLLFT